VIPRAPHPGALRARRAARAATVRPERAPSEPRYNPGARRWQDERGRFMPVAEVVESHLVPARPPPPALFTAVDVARACAAAIDRETERRRARRSAALHWLFLAALPLAITWLLFR
jgi:hypothetical protein